VERLYSFFTHPQAKKQHGGIEGETARTDRHLISKKKEGTGRFLVTEKAIKPVEDFGHPILIQM